MNKQRGELAREMGTLVEDIASPAARPVIRQYFGCEPTFKARNVLRQFFEFFPEYRDRRLVRVLAGLEFPENVLRYATRRWVYAMAYREWEFMDILNFHDILREGE